MFTAIPTGIALGKHAGRPACLFGLDKQQHGCYQRSTVYISFQIFIDSLGISQPNPTHLPISPYPPLSLVVFPPEKIKRNKNKIKINSN